MADTNNNRPLAAVVLAAGMGTRMRSPKPKVLHEALGRSLLGWVLSAIGEIGVERTVVVIGHGGEAVAAHLGDIAATNGSAASGLGAVTTAVQEQQRGSGDALDAALPALEGFDGDVLVVNGDGALFTTETMQAVVGKHRSTSSSATALAITSYQDLPYGRVICDEKTGELLKIVEVGDASEEELLVRELNAGVYCFASDSLREDAPNIGSDNTKNERYITDMVTVARSAGRKTAAAIAGSPEELLGVNTHTDLAKTERILQKRVNRALMDAGTRITLPNTVLIEPTVTVEPGAHVEAGCVLRGSTSIAVGATVGPHSTLTNTVVKENASVIHSYCTDAIVGPGATVGPFGYLRPSSELLEGSKVGAFVELKNTTLRAGAKVPHLSYIGDADVGERSNIGAGTITANYRPELGKGKQRTTIGADARTGSDNVFVAPITIGDGAYTAAGSIITEDVPAAALAIARARQVNLPNYEQRLAAKQQPSNS